MAAVVGEVELGSRIRRRDGAIVGCFCWFAVQIWCSITMLRFLCAYKKERFGGGAAAALVVAAAVVVAVVVSSSRHPKIMESHAEIYC